MIKNCISLCLLFLPTILSASPHHPASYLSKRIDPANGRYKTFIEVLKLLDERKAHVIVETGTERWQESQYCFDGDGGSTIIFAHWATENDAQMYSVDINETHLGYCAENTRAYSKNLKLILSDSVAFLQNFPDAIDFLYLDSYDYDEKNPRPAQEHCLSEVKAAEDKLTTSSVVMIDDCNVPGGGKGFLAIQYLLSKGWVLHQNHHQVILLKSASS